MIHFDRNGNGTVAPESLVGINEKRKNDAELGAEHDAAKTENRSMKFKSQVYGSRAVKDQLKRMSYGKCCYCDRRIEDIEHCDVEHFRPKVRYWWIAYTWENLLLSCQICNQSYKRTYFPVQGRRVTNPTSNLNSERHLLINPADEDPESYIAYDSDGDGVSVIARNGSVTKRVNACIRYYGLNREKLLDGRRVVLGYLRVFYGLYDDQTTNNHQKQLILEQMRKMQADDAELAGMVRFYLESWGITP